MLSKSPAERPAAGEVASRLDALTAPRRYVGRAGWTAAALAACVAGGVAVWIAPLHSTGDKPVLLQSLPLDSEPASETAPDFSSDGATIAYASDAGSAGIHHI